MRVVVTLGVLLILVASIAFAGVMGLYAYYARDLPDPGELSRRQVFQTARVFDRNGRLLEDLADPSGGLRTLVPLSQVPPVMRQATIDAEDASFYSNPGFDPRAIVRAAYQMVRYGSPQSGASTITQQLVKNTLLGPEQTAERKIKEAFLAIELTRRYSKDQILEMYLNEINYGNRAYGVEAAAETYFGKPARELTLPEASLLAGLPQAPSYYDPYVNLAAAKERQQYVLDQMVRVGDVTPLQAANAVQAPLNLRRAAAESTLEAPHFVNYVRQLVEDRFGTDAMFHDGLQVTTSLDLDAQHLAEQVARDQIAQVQKDNADNAALVSIRPSTGEILAMLGSVNFDDVSIDGQVNVALADRQPGSALKPFTYLTAFGKGWNPATMLMDVPTTFGDYRPNDFDNQFRGPVRVRQALAQSLNVPAVEALQFVGIPEMLATVHRMGVTGLNQPGRYGLSVTLGGGEVRLLDLTYAYAALANGGQQVGAALSPDRQQPGYRSYDPVAIVKVTDSTGKLLYQYQPPRPVQVADPRLVYQVTSILSDNQARAPTFGPDNPLVLKGRPSAAKTGTTDHFVDAWTVGYTPDLVTGVWVGNTDSSPMNGIGGSTGAGVIWNAFMEQALANTPPTPFIPPQGVVRAQVCALSGLLPTDACRRYDGPIHGTVEDVFVPGVNLPTQPDDILRTVEVCKVNGKLATSLVPPNGREWRAFATFPAPYGPWAAAHGYAPPPTETCDDVYKGEHLATISGPADNERITAGAAVQVSGTAYVDDFHDYTLEVGPGRNPDTWATLTDHRAQAVDNALLGVWSTAGLQPGQYTFRLRVYDSLGNAQEGRRVVQLAPAPTPTPLPRPTPSPAPTRTTPGPASTPAATPPPPARAPVPTPAARRP